MTADLRIFDLVPKPRGHGHATLRSVLECIEAHGVPGFTLQEVLA